MSYAERRGRSTTNVRYPGVVGDDHYLPNPDPNPNPPPNPKGNPNPNPDLNPNRNLARTLAGPSFFEEASLLVAGFFDAKRPSSVFLGLPRVGVRG